MSATNLQGRVSFIQHHLPSLEAGEYRITATTAVRNTSGRGDAFHDTISETTRFAVVGNRFRLNPDDLHSVYPPANLDGGGEFENTLPHIVLRNRTLPWQYSPTPHAADRAGEAGNQATWRAVLLVDQDQEGAQVRVHAGRVRDAQPAPPGLLPAGMVSYPGLHTLDYGESPEDTCDFLDLPLELFAAIAPATDELQWLAHARRVAMNKKEFVPGAPLLPGNTNADAATVAGPSTEQDFSCVVGNRLPRAGAASTAYLVSLEGLSEYLPDSTGTPSAALPAATTHVRLIVLHSWSFRARALAQSFTGLLENVSSGPLRVAPPEIAPEDDADVRAAKQAIALGYVPLQHELRGGDVTVSYYRGPLVPYAVPEFLSPPFSGSDAALRYDPETGIFDTSYAAAFEIGRLLALQNQNYATALYQWKRRSRAQTIAAIERDAIFAALGATLQADPIVVEQPVAMMRVSEAYMTRKLKAHLVVETAPEPEPPPDTGEPPPGGGGSGPAPEPPATPLQVWIDQVVLALRVIVRILRRFLEFFRILPRAGSENDREDQQ